MEWKYRIGQRVILLNAGYVPEEFKYLVGASATIEGFIAHYAAPYYVMDLQHRGEPVHVAQIALRPIDDRGSWDEITRLVGFDIRTGRPQHVSS